MKITLYYNPSCPKCARQAKRTAQMDWLNRVELLAEDSPLGPVPKGEIIVVEKKTREMFSGVYATQKVCLQIPLFFLYGLALYLPFIRKIIEKEK